MASYSIQNTATTGQTLTAAIWNTEFTAVQTALNSISNSQIASDATIALSKLATGALPSGITIASANITDGTIVNDDINASAAIAASKISFTTTTWTRHVLSLTSGDISTGAGKDEFTVPATIPASKWVAESVELEVDIAPGSSKTLTVDVNKGGATILSSAISLTGSTILSTGNTPSVTAMSAGDRFTIDIDTATSGLSTTRVRANIIFKQYMQS